jgi:hypothetical protein
MINQATTEFLIEQLTKVQEDYPGAIIKEVVITKDRYCDNTQQELISIAFYYKNDLVTRTY